MTHQSTPKRRLWPFFLIAGGLLLVVVGFVYDVLFAGIPYQDPTPEMSARYARHASIASTIRWCGAGVFLLGSLSGLVRLFTRNAQCPVVS